MVNCKTPLILATTLSLLLLGALTQAFVTSAPKSSLSSGSSIGPATTTTTTTKATTDDEAASKSIGATVDEDEEEDEDENEDGDVNDDFSSMMGVQAASPGQTVYVIEFETEADKASGSSLRNRGGKDISDDGNDGQSPLDPWSIVWYIGSFGGLIAFFLIVSCSEWCCRRGARPLNIPYSQRGEVINATAAASNQGIVTESPPPPYHLFAPPPYDSVNYAEIADKGPSSEKLDIYVISLPIQAAPAQPPPA